MITAVSNALAQVAAMEQAVDQAVESEAVVAAKP